MDHTTTTIIYAAIMGIGFLVWTYSLIKAIRIGQETAEQDIWKPGAEKMPVDKFGAEFPGVATTQSGERTIHGDPEKLSKALVRSFLQINIGMFGSLYEVVERSAKRVVLRKTGPLVCNQPAGLYFSEVDVHFEPLGGDAVRVTYELGYDRLARVTKRVALSLIFGVGLPVMILVGSLIWFLVVQSDEPWVRWQVLQCFHIAHAIWPPFLLIGMYSMGRRHSKTFMSNLLSTLELAD